MCIYQRYIENPRYASNKKNGGIIPAIYDTRAFKVPIDCEECMECRAQATNNWRIRLQEDIKYHPGAKFITLTFSDKGLQETLHYITKQGPHMWEIKGYERDNAIAKMAMRMFNERYRSITGKALRHWCVTELGHEGTENIHLHGIIWPGKHKENKKYKGRMVTMEEIEEIWGNGWVWKYKIENGVKVNYVNNRTVNYITKYVSKRDLLHKHYKPLTLASPGIGSGYIGSPAAELNKFNGLETRQYYVTREGFKMALPKYYRNKIYTDEEREWLWMRQLDKHIKYVCGEKIDVSKTQERMWETIKYYRKKNRRLGYGSYHKDEDRLEWEIKRREEMFIRRIKRAELDFWWMTDNSAA